MLSEYGKDFDGRKLTENSNFSEVSIVFRKKFYSYRLIKNDFIELCEGNSYVETAKLRDCRLYKLSSRQQSKVNDYLWQNPL